MEGSPPLRPVSQGMAAPSPHLVSCLVLVRSAHLVANARTALVGGGGTRNTSRYALTPVLFVRFSEHKTVDPNYSHKSGVTALLDQLLLTADIPDVACVDDDRCARNTSWRGAWGVT